MLTYLINSLFKNNKFAESLQTAEELRSTMLEYDGLYYKKYLIYYYNSLVINYQVTNKLKAVAVLEEAKTKAEIQELPIFSLFIYLNLSVLFFNIGDFKQSKKNLIKLKLQDDFSNLDSMLQYKINIFELMIIFELEDSKLFKLQLNTLKLAFKSIIITDTKSRDNKFINLLVKMIKTPKNELKELIFHFNKTFKDETDSDIINYNNWLESKLK